MAHSQQWSLFPEVADPATPAPSGKGLLNLFFALFPPMSAASRIASTGETLRRQHGLHGSLLETGRLHVTLIKLGTFVQHIPQPLLDSAMAAAASIQQPGFNICFEQAMSFPTSEAYALCGGRQKGAELLAARLRSALRQRFPPQTFRGDRPHMTLLYDRTTLVAPHAVEPVSWWADEFVLVLSHVGETRHDWLGRWPLATTAPVPT